MRVLLALMSLHFVNDFLLQSDWMAINKSKRWDALAIHVGIYSMPFLLFGRRFAALTFALHFAQDAITSRITSHLWFFHREAGIWAQAPFMVPQHSRTIVNPWVPIEGLRHWFFVAIGADQLLHMWALAWTWWLLGGAL